MRISIPEPLKAEHAELHVDLLAAMRAGGPMGEAARAVSVLLDRHFAKEEAYALPLLGALAPLVRGEPIEDRAALVTIAENLRRELPRMLLEHRGIGAALERLREAAREAGDAARERFAEKLMLHAQTEEVVSYPAALLVGEYLKAQIEAAFD